MDYISKINKQQIYVHLKMAKMFGKHSEEAISYYTKAAKLGHYQSQKYLASYYFHKDQTDDEARESIYWATMALESSKKEQKFLEEVISRNLKILKLSEEFDKDVKDLISRELNKIYPVTPEEIKQMVKEDPNASAESLKVKIIEKVELLSD